MKRGHIINATVATNAAFWRLHINARSKCRNAPRPHDLPRARKGPCQALVQRTARRYRAD